MTEPSALTGFSGNRLERRVEERGPECLAEALAHPDARFLPFQEEDPLLHGERTLFLLPELGLLAPRKEEGVLLGYDGDAPWVALPVADAPLPAGWRRLPIRTLFREGIAVEEVLGALAQARSLLAWNRNHRFCGRCGAETERKLGGYHRLCPGCGLELFPRTDPVVIMLVVHPDGERCLLGRGPHFPPGMHSCLAGFMEPGETVENAVRRETMEESGISVGTVRYHASQPWPMPHSLMIGCYAQALSTEIRINDQELEECRWFSRAEVREMLDGMAIPSKGAIAHLLMQDWVKKG